MVTFTFGLKKARHMQPQGKRHYAIDYDRGAIIRWLADDTRIHNYADEPGVWRNDHGEIIEHRETT
jgi:hypothetical protein